MILKAEILKETRCIAVDNKEKKMTAPGKENKIKELGDETLEKVSGGNENPYNYDSDDFVWGDVTALRRNPID